MPIKVVTFGGGTGQPMVLRTIKPFAINITAVVSMADSGGSSGVLRDEQGILPPSDALRCLLALANQDDPRAALLGQACRYRFEGQGSLVPAGVGHTAGNVLLAALMQQHGALGGFQVMAQLLGISYHHRVLPSTLADVTLVAKLADGTIVRGETHIDRPVAGVPRAPITKVWLDPPDNVTSAEVVQAIQRAAMVLIPPGDLFTSIAASLLPGGIKEAILASVARIVVCVNTMTKVGETDGCGVAHYVQVVEGYLGRRVNVVICNTGRPDPMVLESYASEGKSPIEVDVPDGNWEGREVIKADLLAEGELARHNPGLLAHALHHVFTGVLRRSRGPVAVDTAIQ